MAVGQLQQLVMPEFGLNHDQRKRKTSKDRAETAAKKAATGQAAQGSQNGAAAAMNTDEIIKALRKKKIPNATWMLSLIDAVAQPGFSHKSDENASAPQSNFWRHGMPRALRRLAEMQHALGCVFAPSSCACLHRVRFIY